MIDEFADSIGEIIEDNPLNEIITAAGSFTYRNNKADNHGISDIVNATLDANALIKLSESADPGISHAIVLTKMLMKK